MLIFLLAFISTKSSFIPSLSFIDSRLKINGSCIQLVKQKLFLVESVHGRTAVTPANGVFFYFNGNVKRYFSIGNSIKLWKISIVTDPMRLIQIESL